MSRYSPQVLPQRSITLPEAAMMGLEAFRATRDRNKKNELQAADEQRRQNQDVRAGNSDRREQGGFEMRQEENLYERGRRPVREARDTIGLMNEGAMAPGTTGGVEVAPGIRIDPNQISSARAAAAQAAAQKNAQDRLEVERQAAKDRVTIAREGDATQVSVARIQASRPSGTTNFFGNGGSANMTPEERAEFMANDRNLKVLGGQTGRAARQVETGLKVGFASPADSAAQVGRYRKLTRDEDRITARQDSLAAGLRRPGTAGVPGKGADQMPFFTPEQRARGASDLDYATQVTQRREATRAQLDAQAAQLKKNGQFTPAMRAAHALALKKLYDTPATSVVGRTP